MCRRRHRYCIVPHIHWQRSQVVGTWVSFLFRCLRIRCETVVDAARTGAGAGAIEASADELAATGSRYCWFFWIQLLYASSTSVPGWYFSFLKALKLLVAKVTARGAASMISLIAA